MRVQMQTIMAGPTGVTQIGQVIDVDDSLGRSLVSAGFAKACGGPVETATVGAPEQAAVMVGKAERAKHVAKANRRAEGAPDRPGRS